MHKEEILLFGTAAEAKQLMQSISESRFTGNFKIAGFLDNNVQKNGTLFYGLPVYHTGMLDRLTYDKIVLTNATYFSLESIFNQLTMGYHVDKERIEDRLYLLKRMIEYRYEDSKDTEAQELLQYLKEHKLSVFNQFINPESEDVHEVFWDKEINLPYILFPTISGNKKMYYPWKWHFQVSEGKQIIKNVLYEQTAGSPHEYINGEVDVKAGDVIVDAGVCEGNFALKYADIASEIYLIESDEQWIEPLKNTFKDYRDKVTICNKALSDRDGEQTITLDTLLDSKCDFLKMDIEGGEIMALLGAEKVLTSNSVKCAITSYHRYRDEERISSLLNQYGYMTHTSKGYMAFYYDKEIFKTADLRRGIVYGIKPH